MTGRDRQRNSQGLKHISHAQSFSLAIALSCSLTLFLFLCVWVSPFVCLSHCLFVSLYVFLSVPLYLHLSLLCFFFTCNTKLRCHHLPSTVLCTFLCRCYNINSDKDRNRYWNTKNYRDNMYRWTFSNYHIHPCNR